MKKRTRIIACLTAGVLILAVSATAAFGSANGYSSYKNAVMDLALKEENFSAKGTVEVKLDGKAFTTMDVNYAQDGVNRSTCTSTTEDGETYIHWDTTLNGVDTWFSSESDVYWQAQVDRDNTSLLGYDKNDEMQSRLINFLSIAADTVAGDLKNNFVQVGSQDGKDLYQVSISGSQVPSLVNAGLSLFAYEAAGGDNYDCGQITWDNYWAAEIAYYEKTTGETLSQELKTGLMEGYDEAFYEAHKAGLKTATHAHGATGIKNAVRAGIDSVEHGSYLDDEGIRIVRKKQFDMRPMYPEDACVQMELLGHSFYMFCNAETEQINVVYKRKGGTYGLIEPEN